ncbi:MAG: protease modulator HflC [Planctomycetota bacterium]
MSANEPTVAEAVAGPQPEQPKPTRLRQNVWTILVALLLAIILLFYLFTYQVPEGSVGVVLRLGDIVTPVDDTSGLKLRLPPPLDEVRILDTRTRIFETKSEECLTKDKINLVITTSVGWTIAEPALFITRLKTVEDAEANLINRVNSARNRALGQFRLEDLVSPDFEAQQAQFNRLEETMLGYLNNELAEADWGVTVDFLAVQQLNFPKDTTEKVFERMKAERSEESRAYRARGEQEAKKIVSDAAATAKSIIAKARAEAEIIRGKADAEAAQYYGVFKENPTLANYLRSLDTLRRVLGKQTNLLLYTEHAPFDLLESNAVPQMDGTNAER